MVLNDFVLLASDTSRTKAYIQMMVREGIMPSRCIVFTDNYEKMENGLAAFSPRKVCHDYFDVNEPIMWTLRKAGIEYSVVKDKDINSEAMRSELDYLPQQYLIYSGYGGYILKQPLFEMGKKIIHVHAGLLPQYRGSTTAYYSLLQEKTISATAIFLNERIDEGEILCCETFNVPIGNVDIDYVYEPYLRSRVLIKALMQYSQNGAFIPRQQDNESAQTYYIIHPVLKHLAIMMRQ